MGGGLRETLPCSGSRPAFGGKNHESWNEVWTSDVAFRDIADSLVEPAATGGSLMLTGHESNRGGALRQHRRTSGALSGSAPGRSAAWSAPPRSRG